MNKEKLWEYKYLIEKLKENELFFDNMHKFIIVYEMKHIVENCYYTVEVDEKEVKAIHLNLVDYLNEKDMQNLFELSYDFYIDSDSDPYNAVYSALYTLLYTKLMEKDVNLELFTEPLDFDPNRPERYVSLRGYVDEIQLLLEELNKLENKDK